MATRSGSCSNATPKRCSPTACAAPACGPDVRRVVAASTAGQAPAVPEDGWVVLKLPGAAVATSVTTHDEAGNVLETVPLP